MEIKETNYDEINNLKDEFTMPLVTPQKNQFIQKNK